MFFLYPPCLYVWNEKSKNNNYTLFLIKFLIYQVKMAEIEVKMLRRLVELGARSLDSEI